MCIALLPHGSTHKVALQYIGAHLFFWALEKRHSLRLLLVLLPTLGHHF